MSFKKVYEMEEWLRGVQEAWAKLTPEARSYKRVRGRERSPEEKKALVFAGKRAWDEWIERGIVEIVDDRHYIFHCEKK